MTIMCIIAGALLCQHCTGTEESSSAPAASRHSHHLLSGADVLLLGSLGRGFTGP